MAFSWLLTWTVSLNRTRLCLVIVPSEGSLADCRIHLTVTIPPEWPMVPPQIGVDTTFAHVRLFFG